MKPGRLKDGKKAFMARKRPLYYNCRILAPDGACLTTCDIRKAEWYIAKGLAGRNFYTPKLMHHALLKKIFTLSQATIFMPSHQTIGLIDLPISACLYVCSSVCPILHVKNKHFPVTPKLI